MNSRGRLLNCCGLLVIVLASCGPTIRSAGSVSTFQGQALNSDGSPLANILVILQPTEHGYEIELEADAEGRFAGEGIPGAYIYYFAESKKGKAKLPAGFPKKFLEPKMEHLVSVQSRQAIVCKIQ